MADNKYSLIYVQQLMIDRLIRSLARLYGMKGLNLVIERFGLLGKSPNGTSFGPVRSNLGGEGWYNNKDTKKLAPAVKSTIVIIDKTASTIGKSELNRTCVVCNKAAEVHYCRVTATKSPQGYVPEKVPAKRSAHNTGFRGSKYGTYEYITRIILCRTHRIELIQCNKISPSDLAKVISYLTKETLFTITSVKHRFIRMKSRK